MKRWGCRSDCSASGVDYRTAFAHERIVSATYAFVLGPGWKSPPSVGLKNAGAGGSHYPHKMISLWKAQRARSRRRSHGGKSKELLRCVALEAAGHLRGRFHSHAARHIHAEARPRHDSTANRST